MDQDRKIVPEENFATCPRCRETVSPRAKFCSACGVRLALSNLPAGGQRSDLEGERRQLTVLFCDMVGSTEMSVRLDIEDYREVVQLYQQTVAAAIATFSGHVAQYLGDGVVAYFGWPLAYGDDAERAVRAGLEVLDALNRLSRGFRDDWKIAARVGIHTGPVLVAKIGIGPGHEVAALGETPNVAARAQGLASPGSVVITDATRRLISGRFVVEPLGSYPLKGVAQPVDLHCVRRPAETRDPQYASHEAGPFVGREEELNALREIWTNVAQGVARVVTLKGEAGIGKSRLVRHFRTSLHDQPHAWFAVACSPFSINTPFAPLIRGLTQAFINRGGGSSEGTLARIERAFAEVGVALDYAIPAIAEMLGLPLPDGYAPMLSSPEQKRRRFIAVISEWLIAWARLQPVVLIVEDAQWADPSTLDLCAYLLERGAAQPIMLIYEARPEFGAMPAPRANHAEFELGRLSHGETLALVRSSKWGVQLPVAAVELVADRSGGVPLFVEELASEMADRGGDAAASRQIPATLADSLMARLDRLGAAKEIAQIAAIIGRDFSYPMLHAIAGRTATDLEASLQRLLAADMINAQGNPPEAHYMFKHALVRDAAYDSLLRSRRRVLHGAVARAMAEQPQQAEREAERLAYHLGEAGDTDAAGRAWHTAGDTAARRGALPEAASHYAKALEMLGTLEADTARDQREMSILMTLASVLSASKGLASTETEETYRRARDLGSRLHPERATAMLGLWQMHVTRGEAIAAQDLAEQRLKIAQLERTPSALCRSHLAVGMTLFHRGKIAGSIDHLRAAVEWYAEGDSRAALFDAGPLAMGYLAVSLGLAARRDEAREMATRSLQAAELLESPPTIAFCRLNVAALHWLLGEPHEVLRVASAGVVFARAHGLEQLACGLEVYVGWATAATGDAIAGVEQIRKAIAGWLANGQRLPHAWFLSFLAWASAVAGRNAAALEIIEEAEATVGEMLLEETIVWSMRAEILAHSGAAREPLEAAWRKVLESARRNDAVLFEARADAALADLLSRDGVPPKEHDRFSSAS